MPWSWSWARTTCWSPWRSRSSTLAIRLPTPVEHEVKERLFAHRCLSPSPGTRLDAEPIRRESPDGPIRLDEDGGPDDARVEDVPDGGSTTATVDSFGREPDRAVDEQLPDDQEDTRSEKPVQVEGRKEAPRPVSGDPPFDRNNDEGRSDE
jgi:hypothetical protein